MLKKYKKSFEFYNNIFKNESKKETYILLYKVTFLHINTKLCFIKDKNFLLHLEKITLKTFTFIQIFTLVLRATIWCILVLYYLPKASEIHKTFPV